MKYLKNKTSATFTVKKSEFIGILYPISSDEDIKEAILDAKKNYPKATHYVTANVLGERGEYASSNDDGEPSRTAGYPALDVLLKNNVTNILCVIVRYYGGIKLGAGGLIRAYSKACRLAFENAQLYNKIHANKYKIIFEYSLIDTIDKLLDQNYIITNKEYLKYVTYTFIVKSGDLKPLENVKHLFKDFKALAPEILHIDIKDD